MKKNINIFGTSFLDLLSGALAAVIILFVVVPKGTVKDSELIKQVEEIKTITSDVKKAIEAIKSSVPKDVYDKIRKEMDSATRKVVQLTEKVNKLEEDIKRLSGDNANLRAKVAKQQDEIDKLKQQVNELRKQLAEQKAKQTSVANTVEKTLGVFAKFGVLCRWTETDTDVDLGVQRFGLSPEQCWRNFPSKKWGMLGEDVRERVDEDSNERFELFYVPQIFPDEYTVWVTVYEKSASASANVSCVFVYHPGKVDEKRQEIGPMEVTKGKATIIASFRLTQSGFSIIETRQPIWGNGRIIK